ncbi:MAG TPA: glycosyltransferase family 2 protein [Hyphomicrobiales bacterium]|nr:glycosyltransferase family 2 protein [Hyphomicrobiales bacterium]
MAAAPLISVLVPTRNRAAVLGPCLATLARIDDPDLEIVVSNNASTDDTAETVAAVRDPRLRLVAPDAPLAMTDNFELALSAARGDYVIAIGDDDGMLASGWRALRRLIAAEQPAIVNWRPLPYVWPSDPARPVDGVLTIKPHHLGGGHRDVTTAPIFAAFLAGRIQRYRQGANIYHGCVSRPVIEAVRQRFGRYFFANAPDVGAAIANLLAAPALVQLDTPVSIGGSSRYSTGTAFKRFSGTAGADSVAQWIAEAPTPVGAPTLPRSIRSIQAMTFDALMQVVDHFGVPPERVDGAAWLRKIAHELDGVPEPWRSEGRQLMAAWLTARGLVAGPFAGAEAATPPDAQAVPVEETAPRTKAAAHRLTPWRIRLASRPGFLADVRETAELCDAVIGNGEGGGLSAVGRMAAIYARARRAAASADAGSVPAPAAA